MAIVNPQSLSTAGLAPVYSAASAGGDQIRPGAGVILHAKNASGAAVTLTLVTPQQIDGLDVADRAITIPAAADRFVTVPDALYLNRASGLADITWSAAASVSFAVLQA